MCCVPAPIVEYVFGPIFSDTGVIIFLKLIFLVMLLPQALFAAVGASWVHHVRHAPMFVDSRLPCAVKAGFVDVADMPRVSCAFLVCPACSS